VLTPKPSDVAGTENEVAVVSPEPSRPLDTPGHGKNVKIEAGEPCSSP